MPIYTLLYNYGSIATASTTETTPDITKVRGNYGREDDHIKFGTGVFRWESTTDINLIAGDFSVDTFEKGHWPPPPGRALQQFGPYPQLKVDVNAGTGDGPSIKYVALFIYENTDFTVDPVAMNVEVTQVLDGSENGTPFKRDIKLQPTTQLQRGVYRFPASLEGVATATYINPVFVDPWAAGNTTNQQQPPPVPPAPAFDGIVFDEHTWPQLPPTIRHAFGSAKKIHDALLGTTSSALRPRSS